MSELLHSHADQQNDQQLTCEGSQSFSPPPFSLMGEDPPPSEQGDDLTGLQTVMRIDSWIYLSPDAKSLAVPIPRNTPIQIIRDQIGYDWAEVRILNQVSKTGFVNRNYIYHAKTDLKEGTELYKVKGEECTEVDPVAHCSQTSGHLPLTNDITRAQLADKGIIEEDNHWYRLDPGDTLEEIIKENYPERLGGDMDLRTIANAILFVNNPGNDFSKGIYVENDGGFMEDFLHGIGYNYNDIEVRAGYDILLPSWATILDLRTKVKSGSISLGLVEEIWPDGFGCYLNASLGGAFVFLQGKGELAIYFYRKGDQVFIHFSLLGGGGAGAGAGVGMMIAGKGQKKGLGAEAGFDVSAMGEMYGLVEFGIPLRAGVIADFLYKAGKMVTGINKAEAAAEFVDSFGDDPLKYLYKAKIQGGPRFQGQGEIGATIMEKGDKARTEDRGNGTERSDYQSTTSNRVDQEEHIHQTRTTLRDALTKKDKKLEDWVISDLAAFIRALASFYAEAGMEYKFGIEYGKSEEGYDEVSMFAEGQFWGKIGLPILPLGINLGIGGRVVWVRKPDGWEKAPFEAYAYGGDLDEYVGPAYELALPTGEPGPDLSGFERFYATLRQLKFEKRIMVNIALGKGERRRQKLSRVRALVSSDSGGLGGSISGSLTIKIDLGRIKEENAKEVERIIGELNPESDLTITEKIMEAVQPILSDNGDHTLQRLADNLVTQQTVTSLLLHLEAGIGGSFGFKAGQGAKIQMDLGFAGGIVFEKEMLEYAKENKLLESSHNLAGAVNSDPTHGDQFAGKLIDNLPDSV